MKRNWLIGPAAMCCLVFLGAAPALAQDDLPPNVVQTATVASNCTTYNVAVTGDHLGKNKEYVVKWSFGLQYPDGTVTTFKGRIPVHSMDSNGDFNKNKTYNWSPPLGAGSYAFTSGRATLFEVSPQHVKWNTVPINFNPTEFSCPGMCQCNSSNSQGFNGTQIPVGDYIWFNSNFTASGIPSKGTTLYFTNSTITFTSNGTQYTVPVPNGQVTFTDSVSCATTSFDTTTNTWLTQVPLGGDDEILMQDAAWLVPSGFGKVTGNVTWNTTMSTNDSGISVQWKWGAAVYSQFTTDYSQLMVKPTHNNSCSYDHSDHAGTPEGDNSSGEPWKNFVVGGGTGGGGANFTGSWSGTTNASITCPMH